MNYLSSVVVMVGICVAIGGRSEAGTITKCKVAQQLSVKETHTRTPLGGLSDTTFRFSLTTGLEADTSVEASGLGPNTLIQGSVPLGPSSSFRLTDDPDYEIGDTSVKFTTTEVFNDIEWKRSIKMRWDKGKLKLTAKVSASQKLNQPATVEWENVAKSKTKNTSPAETLVSLFRRQLRHRILEPAGDRPDDDQDVELDRNQAQRHHEARVEAIDQG